MTSEDVLGYPDKIPNVQFPNSYLHGFSDGSFINSNPGYGHGYVSNNSSIHGPFRVPKRRGRPIANNAARERSRVKTLRSAFLELQRTLPAVPPDTKLSKLDVLVLATTYIAHLMSALHEDGDVSHIFAANGCMHPVKVRTTILAKCCGVTALCHLLVYRHMLNVFNHLLVSFGCMYEINTFVWRFTHKAKDIQCLL